MEKSKKRFRSSCVAAAVYYSSDSPPRTLVLLKYVSNTMKVLVGVKRVVDYAVKVRVNKGTVDLANVKQSMNPFCEVRMTSHFTRQQSLNPTANGYPIS